jgi:hypothetical protein
LQQFHFQDEEALKAERVTDVEARELVHLWAENQKQAATASGPTVHDIAEGLEIPPEEALRLLQQVRQKQVSQVETRVRTTHRSSLIVASAVFALIALVLMGLLASFRSPAMAPATVAIEAPRTVPVSPPVGTSSNVVPPTTPAPESPR